MYGNTKLQKYRIREIQNYRNTNVLLNIGLPASMLHTNIRKTVISKKLEHFFKGTSNSLHLTKKQAFYENRFKNVYDIDPCRHQCYKHS